MKALKMVHIKKKLFLSYYAVLVLLTKILS